MKGRKVGVILGYMAMLFQNLASFILTPLLIVAFGDGDFGVYKLVLSISSYFALADLGLSNAIVRYISEYRARKDKISESKFVSLILLIDVLAASALMLMGIFMYSKLPLIFGPSFLTSEMDLLKNLFFLTLINGVFNLFTNLTSGIIKSYENFALLKVINILRTFVRFSVALVLITFGKGAFSIILLDTILSLLILASTSYYCIVKLRIKVSFNLLSKKFAKEILSYSLIVFIDAIAFHLFWNADNFIIGMFLSSSAIAIYSIGTQISSLFFSFSIIVSDVIMPGIVTQVTNQASDEELTMSMIKIGRIKLILIALPVIGFIFLGDSFINFWVGDGYTEAYAIALLVIIPSMIAAIYDAGFYIMWAKNKHKIKSIVSLVISGINIVITVVLVKAIGIIGAAIGTAFAYTVGYILFNTVYFHRVLNLDMIRFSKETLSKTWIPILGTVLFALTINQFEQSSFFYFIAKVILITLIYVVLMWKLGLNKEEKTMISNIFKKPISK